MTENGHKICVGEIVGVHGIKGEVKVKSFTETDRNLERYGTLCDERGRLFEVKVSGHSKELLRVKIKGVDDRNRAKELIGCRLYAERSALPELTDEDEFYQADLIGLEVRSADGTAVGTVAGIYNFGAGEILEIKLAAGGQREMIPFSQSYVPEVNIKGGFVTVRATSMLFAERDGDEI